MLLFNISEEGTEKFSNVATVAELSLVPQVAVFALAAGAGASGLSALLSLSAFDKKAAKYTSKEFNP